MKKKLHLLHPFLFAILPAVFLWGQNFGEVPLREVLPTLAVALVFGALVWLVLWFFIRNFETSALVASFFLVLTLLFDYVYEIFFNNALLQLRFRWAVVILAVVFVAVWYVLTKTERELSQVNRIITGAVSIFLLISLFQVAFGYYSNYRDVEVSQEGTAAETIDTSGELRDIYYIVLDGYSSPEVVRDVLGFEPMDETVAYLETQGFYLPKESSSNYPSTLWSLPSSLNMRYLDDPGADKRHFTMAENHQVKTLLKAHGYSYFHFGADAFTYFNRYADENINIGLFSPYQTVVWHTTIFKPIQDLTGTRFEGLGERFGFLDSRRTQWERERFKLERLREVAREEDDPIFAFAHFLIPKGDYVFDEDGNFVTAEEAREKGNVKSYLDQVAYINKEIKILVDTLLDAKEPEPIIIIQGDHGFAFYNNRNALDEFVDPERAQELVVPGKYSFPIFNAYYLPDGGNALLYDSITPVNTFRIVFSYYFGEEFALLEDVQYTVDPNDATRFIVWEN